MRAKISLRAIAVLPTNSIIWDTEIRGLNVRRQFSDVVTYSIVYRTLDGVQRWQRIGRHGVWTPDLARKQARSVLMARDLGKDPTADKMALRSAPTVAELCDSYMADMDAGRINGKKASTVKSDKSRIGTHILPKLGKLKVASVTREHVETFMHSLSPGSAKRVTGLLGAIFSFAVKKGLRETNPVHGVDKPADVKRMRRLSDAEYAQLWSALDRGAAVAPIAASVLKLLVLTGWRSSEAKNLRWDELDLPRHIATLGDTKSGMSVRPLSKVAVEIIEAQPRKDAFVFSNERGRLLSNLRPHWLKLEMPEDVSPHTLRHSFASLAADLGHSDNTIASLLGHSRGTITSRYMHLADKSLIAAADGVALETMRIMQISPKADSL
jgi:integrase